MGRSSDLTYEQQMAIKALSTAGKMQGEISKQVGCSQSSCEQVSARQVIWTNEMWPQTCDHQAGQPEAGETGALGTDFRSAGKLPSSGMLMVCPHHDQQAVAE